MGAKHKNESDFPMNLRYLHEEHQFLHALPDYVSQEVLTVVPPSLLLDFGFVSAHFGKKQLFQLECE